MKIIYGMTLSDRPNNYVPYDDGYRPGARQDMFAFEIDNALIGGLDAKGIAERFFIATNAPDEALPYIGFIADRPELVHAMRRAVSAIGDMGMQGSYTFAPADEGTQPYVRAMSIGDTLSMEGLDTMTCDKQGFVIVRC